MRTMRTKRTKGPYQRIKIWTHLGSEKFISDQCPNPLFVRIVRTMACGRCGRFLLDRIVVEILCGLRQSLEFGVTLASAVRVRFHKSPARGAMIAVAFLMFDLEPKADDPD